MGTVVHELGAAAREHILTYPIWLAGSRSESLGSTRGSGRAAQASPGGQTRCLCVQHGCCGAPAGVCTTTAEEGPATASRAVYAMVPGAPVWAQLLAACVWCSPACARCARGAREGWSRWWASCASASGGPRVGMRRACPGDARGERSDAAVIAVTRWQKGWAEGLRGCTATGGLTEVMVRVVGDACACVGVLFLQVTGRASARSAARAHNKALKGVVWPRTCAGIGVCKVLDGGWGTAVALRRARCAAGGSLELVPVHTPLQLVGR
jgi:hypothetical protein